MSYFKVQFVFVRLAIVAAAVVQIEHKAHAGMAYKFLNTAHRAEFGVAVVERVANLWFMSPCRPRDRQIRWES